MGTSYFIEYLMKQGINLGQALGFAITIVGACVGVYASIVSRMAVMEEKLKTQQIKIEQVDTIKNEISEIKADQKILIYKLDQLLQSKGK